MDYSRDERVVARYLNLGLLVFGVRMKMDYFQVDWCQDVVLVALAFAADQLVACSLDVVELEHRKLSPEQLVKMELEYLMMLVIENQVVDPPKLLRRFQLSQQLFSQQLFSLELFSLEPHLQVD